jgi:hypothetical protein
MIDVIDDRLDSHLAVDSAELSGGGLGLGQVRADVVLIEEHLSMEVMGLNEVSVDDAEVADTRAHEGIGEHAAQRSAADEYRAGGEQAFLAFLTKRGEKHLPGIA